VKTYLPWLDLLRLVSILLVIVNHVDAVPHGEMLGHSGVGLFFSISGFLIGSILQHNQRKPQWMRLFYAHRFLRIYPAYVVALAVYGLLLLTGLQHTQSARPLFFANLPYYLTFTFHLGPDTLPMGIVWSLCVEEFFYLLFPLAFLLGSRTRVLVALVLLSLLNLEPRFFTVAEEVGTWYLLPHNLIGGAILALLKPRPTGAPWPGFLGLGALLFNAVTGTFHPFGPVMELVTTVTVWSFATTRTPYPRPLSLLLEVGKLSYGIYLLHLPVCSLALRVGRFLHLDQINVVLYFSFATLLALVISALMAGLMHRLVEQPILNLRRYVPSRPLLARGLMMCQLSLIPLGVLYHVAVTHLGPAVSASEPAGAAGGPAHAGAGSSLSGSGSELTSAE
jgi:peptidoglycan/LPS O-acetylase OafA/YrhL